MASPSVTLANGADASGMATLLGGPLEDNLRGFPGRARVTGLARGDVILTASDRDVSVTLSFRGDEVVVANGKTEGAAVLAGALARDGEAVQRSGKPARGWRLP